MGFERIDLSALSKRLVAARKRAGLTQEAVASSIGCSRPTLIAMEKGSRVPKASELTKLAKLYREPLNRLLRTEPLVTEISPHLREMLKGPEEAQKHINAAVELLVEFIDDYKALERICDSRPSLEFPPPVRLPRGSVARFAEHCATEERARLRLGDQPIHQLRKVLEEEVGLRVFCGSLESKIAGLYAFVPAFGYCILINAKHPLARRRWTIAHEFGHFLADRDRPGIDRLIPTTRKSISERFADSFAAAFLMPSTGVRRHFYEAVDRTGDFKVGDLLWLSDLYAVSFQAMTLRLEQLKLISSGTWEDIQADRVRPSRVREETGLPAERVPDRIQVFPERYRMLAMRAFFDGKISEGELARFLRTDRLSARAMAFEYVQAPESDEMVSYTLTLPVTKSVLANLPGDANR